MSSFKRIAISNRHLCSGSLQEQAAGLEGRVDILILREKDLEEAAYRKLAEQMIPVCKRSGIRLICHTFRNAAEAAGCRSIHLTFDDFIQWENRPGTFTCVGVSVHTLEEALQSEKKGAQYVIASNIFETDCKKGLPGKGTAFLREICEKTHIEVYGLGGITDKNEPLIRACGAEGACRMSDYMK